MRGRGEVLEAVALHGPVYGVVVVPPFRLATPAVFGAWDALGGPRSTRVLPPPSAVAHLIHELVNDLEPAAEAVEPALVPFRARVEGVTGRPAILAGSGSSHFVSCGSGEEAAECADRAGRAGITAWATASSS